MSSLGTRWRRDVFRRSHLLAQPPRLATTRAEHARADGTTTDDGGGVTPLNPLCRGRGLCAAASRHHPALSSTTAGRNRCRRRSRCSDRSAASPASAPATFTNSMLSLHTLRSRSSNAIEGELLTGTAPVAEAEGCEARVVADRQRTIVDDPEHRAEGAVVQGRLAPVLHLERSRGVERTVRQAHLADSRFVDVLAGRSVLGSGTDRSRRDSPTERDRGSSR